MTTVGVAADLAALRSADRVLVATVVAGGDDPKVLAEIPAAADGSFRAAFCTEGGSMGPTGRRIFAALDAL